MPDSPKILLFTLIFSIWKLEAFWEEKTENEEFVIWGVVLEATHLLYGNSSRTFCSFREERDSSSSFWEGSWKTANYWKFTVNSSGKISKGADSSQQPKQTVSILTDPDPRTGKRKELVAARVNSFISSSSNGLTQLSVNCKPGSQQKCILSILRFRCDIFLACHGWSTATSDLLP